MSPPFSGQKDQNVRNTITNQREITPKISIAVTVFVYDIIFLCFMTHRLIVLYNCMKFHSNCCNGFNLQSGHEITLQMMKGK